MAYTMSMPQPSNHLFHVTLRIDGLKGEFHDLKMPAWHPGYYRLIDYAKNVSNFRAADGAGRALPWEKVTKNTWRVAAGNASTVILTYDVLGTVTFSAQNYLSDNRAFVAPTGGRLTEILEYASTTKDVDYAKYFGYAGLDVSMTSDDAPGSYLGLNTQAQDGKLVVSGVSAGSPAENAGIIAQDQILEVDGAPATPKGLNEMLSARKPGDKATLRISRHNTVQELEATLGRNMKRTFQIQPVPNPTALQTAILKDWWRCAQ